MTLPNSPWPQLHGFKAPERLLHFSDRSPLLKTQSLIIVLERKLEAVLTGSCTAPRVSFGEILFDNTRIVGYDPYGRSRSLSIFSENSHAHGKTCIGCVPLAHRRNVCQRCKGAIDGNPKLANIDVSGWPSSIGFGNLNPYRRILYREGGCPPRPFRGGGHGRNPGHGHHIDGLLTGARPSWGLPGGRCVAFVRRYRSQRQRNTGRRLHPLRKP